jgi:peptidoglycan/xylan/chitin deacetylase (PgdA/CDA1 family)
VNIRTHAPAVVNAGTSSTGWSLAVGATIAAATTPDGVTAIKGVSASGGHLRMNYDPVGGSDWTNAKGIEIDVYCETATTTGITAACFLANDSGFAAYFVSGDFIIKPGWNKIRLGRRDFTTGAGSPTWAADMAVFRISFSLVAATVLTMYVKGLSKAGAARPQVPIIFDDGYESVYTEAFPYMAARGLVGTVGVISSKVGTSGFMTESQLDELHDAGWALCNHTQLHQQNVLSTAVQSICYDEIMACQEYLVSKGWTRDNEHLFFFAPYGEFSDPYLAAAVQTGCVMFRGLFSTNENLTSDPPMSDTPGNLFPCAVQGTNSTWTLAQMTNKLDRIISGGRTVTGYLFHDIATPADSSIKTTIANFQGWCDYAYRRKAVCDFPTVPELYKHWQDVAEYA